MKCPFCKQEIKHLARHIAQKHPKKFKFLEQHKPKLYSKLKKELQIEELINRKDPNLLIFNIGNRKYYYKFNCLKCGKCCSQFEIEILRDDVDKWEKENRIEILKGIQIFPKSISIMNLGLIANIYGINIKNIDLSQITIIRDLLNIENFNYEAFISELKSKGYNNLSEINIEKIKNVIFAQTELLKHFFTRTPIKIEQGILNRLTELRHFILNNHIYLGEPKFDKNGNIIQDSLITELKQHLPQFYDEKSGILKGKIPHWLLGSPYSSRSIFSPKNFNVIKEGWNFGLQYYLIYELKGHCEFLVNNLCSIHEYKPKACKLFPYNRKKLEQGEYEFIISVCKGLKRLL
ncbi:MAG: YkgJ family cysteine cluster protein [Promethearchaeia archaeon]